jgi:hypothetical protein
LVAAGRFNATNPRLSFQVIGEALD